jgi:Escherichia/Staphylococcus phage prohead protease
MAKNDRLIERRFVTSDVELRMTGGKTYIEGYAAVFNKRSDNLGGFVETVENTAFNKTAKEADVRALYNHNPNFVLGRSKAGTLQISIDSTGLHYRALAPDTSYARDLTVLLERGDVRESSFAFFNIDDKWDETEDNMPLRHLHEVGLVDVSPVTYPAYPDATSGVIREAALAGLAKRSGCQVGDLCNVDAIRDAIRKEPNTSEKESRNSTQRDGLTQTEWAMRELAKQAELEASFKLA